MFSIPDEVLKASLTMVVRYSKRAYGPLPYAPKHILQPIFGTLSQASLLCHTSPALQPISHRLHRPGYRSDCSSQGHKVWCCPTVMSVPRHGCLSGRKGTGYPARWSKGPLSQKEASTVSGMRFLPWRSEAPVRPGFPALPGSALKFCSRCWRPAPEKRRDLWRFRFAFCP